MTAYNGRRDGHAGEQSGADATVVMGMVLRMLAKRGYDVPTDDDSLCQVTWLMASILSRLGVLGELPDEPLRQSDVVLLRGLVTAAGRDAAATARHLAVVR